MDSMMVASNIKKLSRLELLYTCVANVVKILNKNKDVIPAGLEHYCEADDCNKVITIHVAWISVKKWRKYFVMQPSSLRNMQIAMIRATNTSF